MRFTRSTVALVFLLCGLAQAQQIPYLDFLDIFDASDRPEELYRDHIHLSPRGNQLVSQQILAVLEPLTSQLAK